MSKYTWPVRATRKLDAVVSSSLLALVGRLDACTSYVPLPLRSVWLRGALKASLTPPKEKKIQEKKLAEKKSGGRKEAQQERGVLSWAGLHKILANSGEDKAGDQKRLQPQRPKTRPELSAKSSGSICVARGARAGWTAMRRQGRPQIECEAGQGRGWMKRASVWHVMRRALAAPPRWTRVGAGEWWWYWGYWVPTGCRTPPTLGMQSARATHAVAYRVLVHPRAARPWSVEPGAQARAAVLCRGGG